MKFRQFFKRKSKSEGTSLPVFLPILEELAREWAAITIEDIERAGLHLTPISPTDTKLGVLHSEEVRRTWALKNKMRSRYVEARLYAENKAMGEEEVKLYLEQAHRFDVLEDCLGELFWAQAKDDIGGKAWESKSVGVRSGWMFVSSKGQSPLGGFLEIMGGRLPGPSGE